ncbi:MAG: DUF4338 domain-containing protein [Ignavibacterium sp.]|jgi:hypothetical protein|nr:DUF4338 domain-containing protein [Ignavibacterium sp.]
MENKIIVFSNRTFCSEDIEKIKWVRKEFPTLSRSEFISTVCEILNWTTPAGNPKRIQCTNFMKKLELDGIIKLPESKITASNRKKFVIREEIEFDTTEIVGKAGDFDPITLTIAYPGDDLKRWRAYVHKYHKLGDKNIFGSRLQYFIKSGNLELGCMQFSASAWALKKRDEWIDWEIEDKKQRLNLIVNNSRFLIFPWINIKNLASKALSIAIKQIQKDWINEYCYPPVLLETFVDTSCYEGTCYKASNWIYLGDTIGTGRTANKTKVPKKKIFIYPLQKDFREYLKGLKKYKVVEPK